MLRDSDMVVDVIKKKLGKYHYETSGTVSVLHGMSLHAAMISKEQSPYDQVYNEYYFH